MERGASEWKRGWQTLLAAMLGVTISALGPSALGVVMQPLQAEYGWSRAMISLSILLVSTATLVLAPMAGRLISAHGPRRIALISILACAMGYLAIGISGGPVWTWVLAWAVFGILSSAIGPMIWATGISGIFDRHRGIALSLTLSGNGLAFTLSPLLAVWVLENLGWRWVYLGFSAMMLIVYLPVTWFLFIRERRPAGAAAAPAARGDIPPLGKALNDPGFWLLIMFAVLIGAVEGAFMIHLYPILTEGGLSPQGAAATASSLGVALIVGRLVSGVLLDRVPPAYVTAGTAIMLLIASLLAQTILGSAAAGLLVAVTLGCGCGGSTSALAFLVGRYFDMKLYAPIFGTIIGAFGVSYGLSPVLASHVRDAMGSYTPIYAVFNGLLLGATALILLFGRVRRPWTPAMAAG